MRKNEDIFAGLELADETKVKIIELVEDAAQHLLAENIAGIVSAVQEEICQRVDDYLGDYAIPELEQRMDEAVEGVENLIVTLADCGDEQTRAKFIARVAAAAQQTPREPPDKYPGAHNQDGSRGVEDDEAEDNRNSLRPGQGRNGAGQQRLRESYDREANEAMRDAMLTRKRAQDERFHANLLEYVERRDAQTSQGVLSRAVLKV